jgi:hypothetical protein
VQYPNSRILIFAKAPRPGYVKTRLIPAIGAEAAATLYSELLEATVAMASRARLAPVDCWCAPDVGHPIFQQLSKEYGIGLHSQTGQDLGERMQRAAAQTLQNAESVILIGGDCPVLSATHLQQSLAWLGHAADAVLGPAEDGGYVLFGLAQIAPSLFQRMPWGGDKVLSLTRQRLRALDWQWREHTPLWDLDRPEDLARYRALGGCRV